MRALCAYLYIIDIVGRTQGDHDHVMTVNPKLRYYFMNKSHSISFYKAPVWVYSLCRKLTIFVNNSGSPLKGGPPNTLKALSIILRSFPDTVVTFCRSSVMSNHFRHSSLSRLLSIFAPIVKRLHLQEHVRSLRSLSEKQMKQQFFEAN